MGFLWILVDAMALAAESPLEQDLALFKAEQEGQVVISASRYKQMVGEAPASVTIITANEINRYGWRTLADVFRSVRGFYVSDDRNYSYLGVRGFSRPGDFNIRILSLLNGHTLNDDIYQAFLLGRESGIDLDIVDRIEIVRGPGSALYGTSAFFAVVNIVTKKGIDLSGFRTSAEVGSFNTNKGILTYGQRYNNGLDLLFHASYTRSSGQTLYFREFDDGVPAHNSGYAEDSDGESVYSFFSRLQYRDFRFQGTFYDRGKEIPTASYDAVFNDGREESFDGRYFVELEYAPRWRQGVELLLRTYFNWYRYKADYPLASALNKDYTPGHWFGGEVRVDWKASDRHRLIAGMEAQGHHVLLRNYDEEPFFSYLDYRDQFRLYSVYLQDEMRLLRSLALTAGVRYDTYQGYGAKQKNRVTPRTALIYEPIQGSIIKLLYGQAFRVPNSYELFYCGGNSTFVCNPDLKSETISTYEGVFEQAMGSNLKGSLSVYLYDIKNLINLTTLSGGSLQFQNLDRVRGIGTESELRARWASDVEGYLSYTYQGAKNRQTREELSNSPNHTAKAGLVLPLAPKAASLGIEGQYIGRRRTIQSGEMVSAYLIANLNLTLHNLYKNIEVQSSIHNLFDSGYEDPASDEHDPILRIPQKPRNFNVKVTYLF